MRALEALGSPMEPIALTRQGAGHDEGGLAAAHASATALRNGIRAGDWKSLAPYLAATARTDIQNLVQSGGLREFGSLSQAILYALRRLSKDELAALGEVREGIFHPLAYDLEPTPGRALAAPAYAVQAADIFGSSGVWAL